MGRRRKGRAVHGILLLDKPTGGSSNQVLQRVRWLFGAAKAGHTGSLDPLATGMLPICLGEATKLSAQLLDADKTYIVRMQLGVATDTADADGEVIRQAEFGHVNAELLGEVLSRFRGDIEQIPPMYSALKHDGKRLYELARQGQEVERPPRPVTIHSLELLGCTADTADLRVHCSKGTYIRTLVEDIAAAMNTCAHVASLRRVQVGPFDQAMITLDELDARCEDGGPEALDALLLPCETALAGWPEVSLDANSVFYFRRGQPIQVRGAPTQGLVAAYGPERTLLGLARIDDDGRVAPKRLLEFSPQAL